jgi:prepilin-type N-terminal cleavage/methylation domain-containing protein
MSNVRGTRSQSGFSLLEMMVTLAVTGIVSGMAAANLTDARRAMQSDGAMRVVMTELTTAREMAVTQRRNMEVQFISGNGANWVRIIRHEVPGIGTTVLRSVALESHATFSLIPGLPDTPDAFGRTAAIDFGAAQTILFGTAGTLIDGNGNPLNGSVFLAINGVPLTARAVTVLGATGRVRGYKWYGGVWNRV